MSDSALRRLAHAAGLQVDWIDAQGTPQIVSPGSLRAVLAALGLPAHSRAQISESRKTLMKESSGPPHTIVATAGRKITLRAAARHAGIQLETGVENPIVLEENRYGLRAFNAPNCPGYHTLEIDNSRIALIVSPRRAFTIGDLAVRRKLWGVAAQLYALRGGSTKGVADFAALARFAERVAEHSAEAVAISPVHAAMPGEQARYSPYSPSTRYFLSPLFATIEDGAFPEDRTKVIDWRSASRDKEHALKREFARFQARARHAGDFEAFVHEGGPRLIAHARFEALSARFLIERRQNWKHWPDQFRDATSDAVHRLRPDAPDVRFHLFLQWLADTSLADAQARAKRAGMAIGLIADLAVGMDGNGSHAWSAPSEVLQDLTIGAPPDPLGPDGQNWGLTTLSPRALRANGYDSFVATLRAAMRHAGGLRIDHAMGMERLWVIPEGAPSHDGVYLSYPLGDLLRVTALESWRHRAIVIAEDLGTVPVGFRSCLSRTGILGMCVLWFERDRNGNFVAPQRWERSACAMTTTHDLPTAAGWWAGRDIDWRAKTSRCFRKQMALSARRKDRDRLWHALKSAKCVNGAIRGVTEQQVVDGVLRYVATTPCALAIVPVEDIAGEREQPNLPGTIDGHPNWRRRLPRGNGLEGSRAQARLKQLADDRGRK
ncbi:MAG TPA: 4-alpha-glucanotransferase [Rhizomicrobium sp.]|jgi:4-alpha-glucanotransferase